MKFREKQKCLACNKLYKITAKYQTQTKLHLLLCRGCRVNCGCSICFKAGRVFSLISSPVPLERLQNRKLFTLCSKAACRLYVMEALCKQFMFWTADKASYRLSSEYHIIKTCFENPPVPLKNHNEISPLTGVYICQPN